MTIYIFWIVFTRHRLVCSMLYRAVLPLIARRFRIGPGSALSFGCSPRRRIRKRLVGADQEIRFNITGRAPVTGTLRFGRMGRRSSAVRKKLRQWNLSGLQQRTWIMRCSHNPRYSGLGVVPYFLKTFRSLVAKPASLVWSFSSSPLSSHNPSHAKHLSTRTSPKATS